MMKTTYCGGAFGICGSDGEFKSLLERKQSTKGLTMIPLIPIAAAVIIAGFAYVVKVELKGALVPDEIRLKILIAEAYKIYESDSFSEAEKIEKLRVVGEKIWQSDIKAECGGAIAEVYKLIRITEERKRGFTA